MFKILKYFIGLDPEAVPNYELSSRWTNFYLKEHSIIFCLPKPSLSQALRSALGDKAA